MLSLFPKICLCAQALCLSVCNRSAPKVLTPPALKRLETTGPELSPKQSFQDSGA